MESATVLCRGEMIQPEHLPSAIRESYLSFTPAVMPVWMIPGRISKTPIPSGASRAAKSEAIIAAPAFEMQYSARSTETMAALTEVMKMMDR